jgi:secreted trypsin-like serine protease
MKRQFVPMVLLAIIMALCGTQSPVFAHNNGPIKSNPPEIIGGSNAKPGEFPWIVALVTADGDEQFCGGSLIAQDWVLTAAHCFYENTTQDTFEKDFKVVLGTIKLTDGSGQTVAVSKIYLTDYDGQSRDIALLKLAEPAHIDNQMIATIKLNTAADFPKLGAPATIAGWGATNPDGTGTPDVLQKIAIPVTSCESDVDAAEYVCAGGKTMKDSCQGDSGGPLFVPQDSEKPGNYIQVGVTSFGGDTCGHLGAYTRVTAYQQWIDTTMNNDTEQTDTGDATSTMASTESAAN